jgi:hypothetical protein
VHLQCVLFDIILKGVIIIAFIHAVYLPIVLFQQLVALNNLSFNESTRSIYTGTECTTAEGVAGLVADSSQSEVTSNIYGNGGA